MPDRYESQFLSPGRVAGYDDLYRPGSRDSWVWELQQPILRDIIARESTARPSVRLLDYACGTGRVLSFVSGLVDHAEGVDISGEMVALAQQRCPDATVIQGDVSSPGLGQYDVATCFRFILNAQPELRGEVLAGLHARLVDTNGILIVNNHGNRRSLRHPAVRLSRSRAVFRNELSDEQVRTMLTSAGFVVEERHGTGLFPDVLHRTGLATALRRVELLSARRHFLDAVSIDVIYVARAA